MVTNGMPMQDSLTKIWDSMRHPFFYCARSRSEELHKTWNLGMQRVEQEFIHPMWVDARRQIAQLVQKGMPYTFLRHPIIQSMFVRTGFGEPQQYELAYLKRAERWSSCLKYKEARVGNPIIDCSELRMSANSLGMLYYFSRITEELGKESLNSVIEFGGGYGSLCRVFLRLLPKTPTYVIVDLPEMLALQYVFLQTSTSEVQVIPHTASPLRLKEGCVNLVPVYLIREVALLPDLFVSTFALSETTRHVQQIIIDKEFFRARSAYIVGQNTAAQIWRDLSLEHSEMVWQAANGLYSHIKMNPFHFADSWELLARNSVIDTDPPGSTTCKENIHQPQGH